MDAPVPPSAESPPAVTPSLSRAAPKPDLADWVKQHAFGLAALVLGVVGFSVVALTQAELWASPDWRITVPFFVVTLAATVVSLVRREKPVAISLLGFGLSAAALAMGWFLVTAIVIGVTAVIILLLSVVM